MQFIGMASLCENQYGPANTDFNFLSVNFHLPATLFDLLDHQYILIIHVNAKEKKKNACR